MLIKPNYLIIVSCIFNYGITIGLHHIWDIIQTLIPVNPSMFFSR